MKNMLIFTILTSTALFADPSSYLINRLGDDGEDKCMVLPTISGGGCCNGSSNSDCTTNVKDSFAVMSNRLDNNLQRLNARWEEINDEYKDILHKSTFMTKNILEEDAVNYDEAFYIYKNAFESEKYNKLLENESELSRLSSQLTQMEQEIAILKISK